MVKAVGGMKAMKALKSGMKGAKPVIKKKEDENKDDEKKKKVKRSVNALEVLKTPAQTQRKMAPMKMKKRPARVTKMVAEVVEVPQLRLLLNLAAETAALQVMVQPL